MVDSRGRLALIHNGIIENFLPLKKRLIAEGRTFTSDTDTEVVANLISSYLRRRPARRRGRAPSRSSRGCTPSPWSTRRDRGRRSWPPARGRRSSIGLGRGRAVPASDPAALLAYTKRRDLPRERRHRAALTPAGVDDLGPRGQAGRAPRPAPQLGRRSRPRRAATSTSCSRRSTSSRRPCRTPSPAAWTSRTGEILFDTVKISAEDGRRSSASTSLACGTSWHAALVGKFLIEDSPRVPVEVDYGSEYRYRDPIVDEQRAGASASPSPARRPTPSSAMEAAQERGARLFTICNVLGSQATRMQRRRDLHPRRPGDRRRLDQGLHHAARRPSTCSPSTCASAQRHARARLPATTSTRLPQAVDDVHPHAGDSTSRSWPRKYSPGRRTSSTSAAASTTRSRWRARSSSRRSPTSTPRAIPPAR